MPELDTATFIEVTAEWMDEVNFVECFLHYFESVADAREYWKLLNPS